MTDTLRNNTFPSQVVLDEEKNSLAYGLKVARAIEEEWFANGTNSRFASNSSLFHKRRLYARGEQSVEKYKKELAVNGDLSYLNLDWTPIPIIPKFVDIVVNGMGNRGYEINAFSQDSIGTAKRTEYIKGLQMDMVSKDMLKDVKENFNIDMFENNEDTLPENDEELDLHVELDFKLSVELAQISGINLLLNGSDIDLLKPRFTRDITEIGIGAAKACFSKSKGATVEYVDPANLVWSYTEDPHFKDIYYVGEVKQIPINELVSEFPELSMEELDEIIKTGDNSKVTGNITNHDPNKVTVLYFNYKTFSQEVYKLKKTATGAEKVLEKEDSFNPPKDKDANFSKLSRGIEVKYEGVSILGTNKILKWELSKNMLRTKSDFNLVQMDYCITAPSMYNGSIESLVSRIIGFADMIQLTHLKIQQVLAKVVPDGIFLDVDSLADIDLGNGTNYNASEALNMFFQTGSVIGRSQGSEPGMGKPGLPIQELRSGSGANKVQSLINTYNYYLSMIRDVTGLNEARDGSTPDSNALVGLQKLAAANSNVATRHILTGSSFITLGLAKLLSLRISDVLEYSETAEALADQIGRFNTATLEEIKELYLYDMGISLELLPDAEEKQMLENNIQIALSQKLIELDDAIDIREVRSIRWANRLLKVKKIKKQKRDQAIQQQNIQAQSQANIQAQQAAANLEVQKKQAESASESQVIQLKAQLDSQKMRQEVESKKELMELEFQYGMKLRGIEVEAKKQRDTSKEDRKDERTKIQASQQSELIDQRKTGKPPKSFESAGNDILGGGFNLGVFDPK